LRDHVSLRISFSSNSPNTTEARTSPITEAHASPIWNILSQPYFKQTNRDFSALIDEIRTVDAKHERVAQGHTKLEERVMENVKSEFARVEHEMSQKLKEKVNMEIARVETEMKQKLKIAAVAMVVVGAVVGIWTSLTV
ncbi:hypothetical protein HID58_059692, partial [Brassica napus]